MKWLLTSLLFLPVFAGAQSIEYKCHRKGVNTSDATTGAQCYHRASVAATNLATQKVGWIQATCYSEVEHNTTPADIKTAKQALKVIGNFQDSEIQLNTFYIHTTSQLEIGDKNVPAAVANAKNIVKVQTASARSADGEVHCKLRDPVIVNN